VRRMATFYYISIIALVSFFHFHLCTISIFSISTISFSFLWISPPKFGYSIYTI
jgi:hypothetical protein